MNKVSTQPDGQGAGPGREAFIAQSNLLEILARREADLLKERSALTHALAGLDGRLSEVATLRRIAEDAQGSGPADIAHQAQAD